MSKKKRKNASAEVIDIPVPDIIAPEFSQLEPQVKQWEEDLPEQNQEHPTVPLLIRVNEINDVWMEIPRCENISWGGLWFSGFFISSALAIVFLLLTPLYSASEISTKFSYVFFVFLILSTIFFCFRMAIFAPPRNPRSL